MATRNEWVQRLQTLAAKERAVQPCRAQAIKELVNFMADESKKTKLDRKLIDLDEPHEMRSWTESLGCTEQQLRGAVKAAGNSADKVCEYLKDQVGRP
jgi:hypothetical protein